MVILRRLTVFCTVFNKHVLLILGSLGTSKLFPVSSIEKLARFEDSLMDFHIMERDFLVSLNSQALRYGKAGIMLCIFMWIRCCKQYVLWVSYSISTY